MVATVAVAFPSHDSVGPTLLRSRLHFRNITPLGQRCIMAATVAVAHFRRTTALGQRCIMVATVAVAFPSHHSVGPTLYNGCYGRGCISVARRPLGQRCIMVATVAVAFSSQHSVGPTLYNGCNGHGCISVTSLRWANVV